MQKLKRIVLSIAMALTLFTAIPAPKANAGLILLPTGVGLVLLIIGAIKDNLLLIILDADQSQVTAQIEQKLGEKYPFIDDAQALKGLAQLVASKVEANQGQGEVEIKVPRQEILEILAPTGLVELESQKVEALISDLE